MRTHLVALAAFAAMSGGTQAMAASTIAPLQDLGLSGTAALQASMVTLDAWNFTAVMPSPVSPAAASIDGDLSSLTAVNMWLPVGTVTYDSTTSELQGMNLLGGYHLEAPRVGGLTWGGQIDVTDLSVNFLTGTVQGTVTGINTLDKSVNYSGTIFELGTTTYNPEAWSLGQPNLEIAQLTLSVAAYLAMVQGLGGQDLLLEVMFMMAAADLGSLTIDLTPLQLNGQPPSLTPPSMAMALAVPEPGTWALMLTGLVGLLAAARHRAAR